ncbi:extracellular solute-binding protein [Paenibacillus contaminans]|uniref:extracellular solute-binding protein n=1 Tax=Paenibacillus contaminans TaxID=450362 RepID=UPI001314016B|nr:extracellular solute-binding protein [Paenibacillus contaminans]
MPAKYMKRFCLAVISIMLGAGGMTGCTAYNAASSPPNPDAAIRSAVGGKEAKYDPPIEVTMVNQSYGSVSFAEGEDMNANRWRTYIKDHYGIAVKTLWDAPWDQLEQKTNLMISTGEIPDIFLVTPMQLVLLNKAGMIEDLTDVYRDYAPQNVKDVVAEAGEEALEAAMIKGRLMALPFTGYQKETVTIVWIREDWMNKLKLAGPKTMDDLLAISKAFTERDPDGNGKADTYGLPLDKHLGFLQAMFNGYHAYKNIWIKDSNGNLAYGSVQPEAKTALAKMQELYKSGQIDKEFGVKDSAKVLESIGRNAIGIYFGSMTGGYTLADLTPGVRWRPYPLPSIDGKPALLQHALNINYGFWVVRKGMERPEALFKLADVWLKLFYENKDDDLYETYNSDQKIGFFTQAPVQIYKSFKNMEISAHLAPLLQSGKPAGAEELSKLTPEERLNYGFIQKYKAGDQSYWKYHSRNGIGGAGDIIGEYVKNNRFMPDQFIGVPTSAMVQKRTFLDKMELETMIKIITGAPIEQFDQFVTEWKSMGGDLITQEVNEWYKNK